jgi:uncharacterized membrane protein (UPF0136 family)
MSIPAVTSLIYGALVLLGGWMGYRKAGSLPSLISGAASGTLLLLSAVLSATGRAAGVPLAMGVALVLLAFFAYRFARGRKFMPAGLMVAASLAALAILFLTAPGRP